MSLEDFIISVYCLVDDLIKKLCVEQKLCQRRFEPELSDSTEMTMTSADVDERNSL